MVKNMPSSSSALSFDGKQIILRTPWTTPAPGSIALNGTPVDGAWGTPDSQTPTCTSDAWQLAVSLGPVGELTLRITNTTNQPRYLAEALFGDWFPSAFTPALDTAQYRELTHGASFLNNACGVTCVGRKTNWLDFAAPSSMFTVYAHEDGEALLVGILPPIGDAFCELTTLHSEPHFEADFGLRIKHTFGCLVPPGACVRTSPLLALAGPSGVALMEEYGRLWQSRRVTTPRPPVIGWNSWDFHSGAVTRAAMDNALEEARETLGSPVRHFVIDEGWECQWGTWEANWKFADGLAAFCDHVKGKGAVPGIWTAPLLVNSYNPLYLEHPEWFARRKDGQPHIDALAYGPMAYLDVTQPAVLDHIRSIFTRLKGVGFEYFKVDFGQCILNAERFADETVSRVDLLRRAFTTIREAIGPDAYLLSCGTPYESVLGCVDAVRSTGDIHIFWGHVLRNAFALAVRWWMHGNLWNCDPDFLVVRGPDTAAPPFGKEHVVTPLGPGGGWLSGKEFSENEARVYALLVHLSGGDVVLGDCLHKLNSVGREMLTPMLTPRSKAAVPVDLFSSDQELPRVWISRGEDSVLVGVFNWSDSRSPFPFDPAEHTIPGRPRDLWTGKELTSLPATMPRRSCLAFLYG